MLLRGRRAVHWLFAAFATDVAFWYASQSLYGHLPGADLGARDRPCSRSFCRSSRSTCSSRSCRSRGASTARGSRASPRSSASRCWRSRSRRTTRRRSRSGRSTSTSSASSPRRSSALARAGRKNPSRAVRDRVRFLVGVGALLDDLLARRLPLVPRRAPAADRRRARDRLPLRPRRVAHAPAPGRPLRDGRAAPRRDGARVLPRRHLLPLRHVHRAASRRCT